MEVTITELVYFTEMLNRAGIDYNEFPNGGLIVVESETGVIAHFNEKTGKLVHLAPTPVNLD